MSDAAIDLPLVQDGVNDLADIVGGGQALQRHLAGVAIDADLGHLTGHCDLMAVRARLNLIVCGGTATGKVVAQKAAGRLIGCSLELGGKNPMLVFTDADLDAAVDGAVPQGQLAVRRTSGARRS